ncbi:hypothetical protein BV25DRAFT_283943 [Artomyces pyxidatus]|uniref:Uncharacterized protein n=1 Tax=Artomyces pyxidatus TaxID=48021 RepID=A0ACB8T7G7_9AGAM|nr:hypothetical protein BV25DRAFT_283943 [Artomyces pyxidatus]
MEFSIMPTPRSTVSSRPIEPLLAQPIRRSYPGALNSFYGDGLPPVVDISSAAYDFQRWLDPKFSRVPVDNSAGTSTSPSIADAVPQSGEAQVKIEGDDVASKPSPPPPTRQRTIQACEKCRARKTKCSGDHPVCERCAKRGAICQYAGNKTIQVRIPTRPRIHSAPSTTDVPSPVKRQRLESIVTSSSHRQPILDTLPHSQSSAEHIPDTFMSYDRPPKLLRPSVFTPSLEPSTYLQSENKPQIHSFSEDFLSNYSDQLPLKQEPFPTHYEEFLLQTRSHYGRVFECDSLV